MQDTGLPHLPGAATVSDVLRLLELGYSEMKLFPAEVSGGVAFLRAIGAPLPQARFCPTGGITASSASAYLSLANVGCVGGTWLTPADAIADHDWARISRLAAESTYLGS
jgi:2-dehydro-3-deoxyphosphogluconate aldolase/(4S)-4-hydroxy-2-oxoglutarate aldolase